MALTAKFTTDFQSFYDAVQKANHALIDWERNAETLGQTLTDSVNKFSGKELIQNATTMAKAIEEVGGVSKLTAGELEAVGRQTAEAVAKMKALGIEVPPEMQKLADSTKDAAGSTDTLTGSITKLFAGYLTAAAVWDGLKAGFGMFVGFLQDSIAASAAAEQSQARLMSTLRAHGLAVPEVVNAYKGYIDALALTTTHESDALASAAALLTQYGVMPQDMQAALTAVTNLATGERDLDTAAQMVAKAAQGQTGALQKAGITIDETKGKAHTFSDVVAQVNTQLKDAATDAAKTYEGQLANLGKAWGNIKEKIGDAITQNQTVRDLIAQVTSMLAGNTDALGNNRQLMAFVSDVVILAVKAFALFAQVVAKTGESFATSMRELAFFADGIEGLLELVTRFTRVMAAMGDPISKKNLPAIEALTAQVRGFRDGLQDAARRTEEFGKFAAGVADKTNELAANLAATRGQTVQLAGATGQLNQLWNFETDNLAELLAEADRVLERKKKFIQVNKDIAAAQVPLNAAQEAEIRTLNALGLSVEQISLKVKASDVVVKNYINTQIAFEKSTRAFGAAALTTIPPLQTFHDVIDGVYQLNEDHSYSLMQAQIRFDGMGKVIESRAIPAIRSWDQSLANAGDTTKDFGQTVGDFFEKDFGKIIVQGIAGGGNAAKAALTGLGNALFAKDGAFGSALTRGVTGLFGEKGIMGTIGKSVAGMVPMIGSFIGPAIEGVSKLMGKLFGKSEESAKVSPLRDEFFKLQGGIETLNPRIQQLTGNLQLVQAVFDAKTVDAYNKAIADLNAVFELEQTAIDEVNAAAQRYGLTIEELGPAMARQNLDKQAQQLFKDFELLTSAGVDTVHVTERMADAVNKYVKQALQMGTEVPEAMRPMLQKMVDMGQLTDASGNKIETLEESGLSFSMSMSKGFESLIKEVQKLSDVLIRSLGGAVDDTTKRINKIPDKIKIDVEYDDDGYKPKGSKSVPGYQGGTDGKFVDFGAGTLVMLHGREAVVPETQASLPLLTPALGTGAAAAGQPPIVVSIDARGALFGPGSELELARLIERALSNSFNLKHTVRAA